MIDALDVKRIILRIVFPWIDGCPGAQPVPQTAPGSALRQASGLVRRCCIGRDSANGWWYAVYLRRGSAPLSSDNWLIQSRCPQLPQLQ